MRPEKANIVSDLSAQLNESPFILVTDYQHMGVGDFSELRNRLAQAGAQVHVVKNSFLKRAMADAGFPGVDTNLTGQTAVVTGEKEVAPVAKVMKAFAKEFKKAALKVGLIDRAIVSIAELEVLADLPSREVLQAQLLGLLMSPATKLVRLLNEPASAFARLLSAKAKAMPVESAPPAAPAAEEIKEEPKVETATPKAEAATPEPAPKAETAMPETTPKAEAATPEPAPKAETAVPETAPKAEAKVEDQPAPEATG